MKCTNQPFVLHKALVKVQCLPCRLTKSIVYCTCRSFYTVILRKAFPERNLQIPPFFFSQPTNPSSPSGQPPVNGPISPLRQGKTPHPGDRVKNKGADGIAPTLLRKLAIRTSSILQSSAPTVCTWKCRLALRNNFNRFFIDLCLLCPPAGEHRGVTTWRRSQTVQGNIL